MLWSFHIWLVGLIIWLAGLFFRCWKCCTAISPLKSRCFPIDELSLILLHVFSCHMSAILHPRRDAWNVLHHGHVPSDVNRTDSSNLCWLNAGILKFFPQKEISTGALTTAVVAENMLYSVCNISWSTLREVAVANTWFYARLNSFSVIFLFRRNLCRRRDYGERLLGKDHANLARRGPISKSSGTRISQSRRYSFV